MMMMMIPKRKKKISRMLESITIVCDPISLYTHLASLRVFSHTHPKVQAMIIERIPTPISAARTFKRSPPARRETQHPHRL